jgi:hypothetical protein
MKKLLFVLIAALVTSFAANAQASLVQENDYESFSSVNVSDDFSVKLINSPKYSVKTVSDERIAPYVVCYVKNGVLYVSLDRKSFSQELKKQMRVKGAAAPILEAEICCPTIKSLEMSGNTHLKLADVINAPNFTLILQTRLRSTRSILKERLLRSIFPRVHTLALKQLQPRLYM